MTIRLPSGPGALTERNIEVLRLLERGLTNYEIATELGISLEGAKYHVREIMTRLNVESREDAVAAWRREQQPMRRMRRAVLAMFAGKTGWASAAVLVAGLGVLAVVLALKLGGDDATPASPPEPDATATASGNSICDCQSARWGSDLVEHCSVDATRRDADIHCSRRARADTSVRSV